MDISAPLQKTSGRADLEEIYQTYADLYPNPKLLEERRQTDTLLQAARAASSVKQETAKPQSRKGFFTFLFGSREDPNPNPTSDDNDSPIPENDQIQYTPIPNEYDDGTLCGTQQSLDVSCIPPEVYNVARSHLTSTRTRRENPNALKWGPGSRVLADAPATMFVVVGLGEIAEFGSGSSEILQTSDQAELVDFAQRTRQFDLSAVRGTILSHNCLAISWGFLDGITVVYRRKILVGTNTQGWEAVWWIGPSEPILENLANEDLYMDDAEQPTSPLLKIVECVGLHVQTPSEDQEAVVTLVVARLGGYIELVPLPIALWRGPILERKDSPRKPKRRQNARHYASGKRITCPPNTLALTTFEYHLDVQALEVYRTNVDNQTAWDNEKYPDGPPAEFLLVASGVSVDGGVGETMTFWAISTLFASNEEEDNVLDDFQVHSRLLEAIWTGTGSPVSTFATPSIMSRWRTPRQVELKDPTASTEKEQDDSPSSKELAPVTTLSTTAPIVSMKFSDRGPFLSVLDWNGGVQIFDCSVIARLAEQSLTQQEFEQYRGMHSEGEQQEQPPIDFHLVKCIMLRSQIMSALQKFSKIPAVKNLHWMASTTRPEMVLPSLVFLLNNSKKLLVLSFDLPKDRHSDEPLQSSIVSISFPVAGAAMESLAEDSLSFVSLRIGASKSAPTSVSQRLRYFVMEQLQPMAIVETLARESKFAEAIESASKLSKDEQEELAEVVVSCHRQLWESDKDSDSLIATNDELYILNEVLSVCESVENKTKFSLEDLRNLLKLALDISSSQTDEKERVRKAFLRLGTFQLLCRYYESNATLKQFQKEFLQLNVLDLAVELARRGDIPALSIVLYRHRSEVGDKLFHILGSLPLATNSASFCHLLPVIRNGQFVDLFLDMSDNDFSELPWSHMPQYMLERHFVTIAFDRFDEMVVLECNQRPTNTADVPPTAMMVDWFVKRANKIQTFVGSVDDVVNFTKIGMRCSSSTDQSNVEANVPSLLELQTTGRTALSLKRMLLDQAISIDGDGINTDDLNEMDLVELLDLVLDDANQSAIVRYRFEEYIQPLVMEMSVSSTGDHLDESLASYCLNKAKDFNESEAAGAREALISVLAIAEISRVSLPKKSRLIKNKAVLIDMVSDVIDEVSANIDVVGSSIDETREIVECFWTLYQTLPAQTESEKELKLKKVYDDLVGVDILSRWRGCNPFDFFNRRRSSEEGEGNSVFLNVCDSFNSSISEIRDSQDQVSLLQDLLCDVKSLNKIVFKDSVDIAKILCECLLPNFLENGHFGLIASFLGADESLLDRKLVLRNVIEFIDEAMFAGGENMDRISNVMKCQDVLEPLLPEIQSLFQSNRRYLDASHFISTVLLEGSTEPLVLLPSDLKEMAPLDVLETILQEFPESIGCRCSQWLDAEYAKNANLSLRQADAMGGQGQTDVPELPGGAIFHLATILGLESSVSALAVKSRVVHHALEAGYFGAAAAIARTLLYRNDSESIPNVAHDAIKLGAIADVVSVEHYQDVCTKKELCDIVLRQFDAKVACEHDESITTILQLSSQLDFVTSRFDQEDGILSSQRKQHLLSRPIARVYHHTFHEYNRDMHILFKDLASQSRDGSVHDSLLEVLSRFTFYWLIHDAITTKSDIDLRFKSDAEEYLKLGCALLLQIPSTFTAENSLSELQEIALTQAGKVATEERFQSSSNFIEPHPDILRHLVQRGFTENAARKAATMTGNAGPNEAMAWAVGHAMDPDINNPLIMLKSSDRRLIDESSIQVLQKSLIHLSNILQEPLSRSSFLQSLTNGTAYISQSTSDVTTKPKSPSVKSKKVRPLSLKKIAKKPQAKVVEKTAKPFGKNPSVEDDETKKPEPVVEEQIKDAEPEEPQRRRPPPPPPRDKSLESVSNESVTSIKPTTSSIDTKVGNGIETTTPKKTTSKVTPTPPPKPTVPKPAKAPPKVSTPIIKPKAKDSVTNSGIKATPKLPPKPAMDREELRRRGKAALDRLKRGKEGQAPKTITYTPKKTPSGQAGSKPPTPSRPRPTIGAKPTKTPLDREALLKRGQEALQKMRSAKAQATPRTTPRTTSQTESEDDQNSSRRRLIEEGRQLLLQSRSARSAAKPAPPPPPRKPKETPSKPKLPPPPPKEASTKAVKLSTSEESENAGWDFDDFDDF